MIAGAGYAGTSCAVRLARRMRPEDDVDILLVEPNPCQQALSELDLVAVGPNRPEFCELWHPTIYRGLPVTACYNRVAEVLPDEHAIVVEGGERVDYWRLVVATGAVAAVPPIPGLDEHAVTMWSVEDARLLQRRGQEMLKAAARVADRDERRRTMSYTVVGGGATGVEIVGTLAQMLPRRVIDAGLDPADLSIHLVEGRDEILFDLPERERGKAERRLGRMGVEVITGAFVDRVEGNMIALSDGRRVDSTILVWAGGAKADPHAARWGLETSAGGRVVVDPALRTPRYPDVYSIGDVAEARDPDTGQPLMMLAQMAIQEGPATADNILREARGEGPRPFTPHMRGEFVSIGPRWGVGWMYGVPLTGIPAITMKRITYVKYWLQVGGLRLAAKRTREMLALAR
ncbi:MAG TPA: FAD-dependent oxidoreductase [Coriobacteriia bacterium]